MTRIWDDTRCRNRGPGSQSSALAKANSPDLIAVMPDPAEQLQRLYLAGFDLQTFDRFPKCVGVAKDGCIAMLVPSVHGLQMLGTPGWRMGEAIGVLLETGGRQIFQAKEEILEATPERLEILGRFRNDLRAVLSSEVE